MPTFRLPSRIKRMITSKSAGRGGFPIVRKRNPIPINPGNGGGVNVGIDNTAAFLLLLAEDI